MLQSWTQNIQQPYIGFLEGTVIEVVDKFVKNISGKLTSGDPSGVPWELEDGSKYSDGFSTVQTKH